MSHPFPFRPPVSKRNDSSVTVAPNRFHTVSLVRTKPTFGSFGVDVSLVPPNPELRDLEDL